MDQLTNIECTVASIGIKPPTEKSTGCRFTIMCPLEQFGQESSFAKSVTPSSAGKIVVGCEDGTASVDLDSFVLAYDFETNKAKCVCETSRVFSYIDLKTLYNICGLTCTFNFIPSQKSLKLEGA